MARVDPERAPSPRASRGSHDATRVYRSPHAHCSAVIATAAAASARSVRGPSVSGVQAGAPGRSTSSAVHPPSGPTMSRAEAGAGSRGEAANADGIDRQQARLGQQEAAGGLDAPEAPFERLGLEDGRHDGAAALLHGRHGDPLPAVHASRSLQAAEAHLGPGGYQRQDGRHAEHRRVADDAVHRVALGDGLDQRQSHRRLRHRRHLALERHRRRRPADLVHRPAELAAAPVEDPHRVADPQPEDAAEVLRLLARKVDRRAAAGEAWRVEAGVHAATL